MDRFVLRRLPAQPSSPGARMNRTVSQALLPVGNEVALPLGDDPFRNVLPLFEVLYDEDV